MTNLLPPRAKKQIVLEYWVRMISMWLVVWSVSMLVGSLTLYPTYRLIGDSSQNYAQSVADATERTSAYNEISTMLERATRQAQAIIVADRAPSLSNISSDIKKESRLGVTLESLQLSRTDTGISDVQVAGEAVDRQSLAMFKNRLEQLEYVSSVELPIANLAENKDINFTLTVAINPNAL